MLAAAAGGASAEAELRLGAERMPGRTNAQYLRRPSRGRADDACKAGKSWQASKSATVGSLRLAAPPLLALLLLALLRAAAAAGTHDGVATNNNTTTLAVRLSCLSRFGFRSYLEV